LLRYQGNFEGYMDEDVVLIEALADYAHETWSAWVRHMFAQFDDLPIQRWKRQMQIPYSELSEAEKELDREQARMIIAVIRKVGGGL
jgi:hypothetical protein